MLIRQSTNCFTMKLYSQTGLVLELVPTAIVLSGRQVSDSDTAALQMSLGRWQPDFLKILYSTKKLLSDQRYADSLIHKNILPQDGQSGSFHGLCVLWDLCMNNHDTKRWNSLIYHIENGHLLYKILRSHLLKLWLSGVDYVSLHSCRTRVTRPSILMIHSPTWQYIQPIKDLAGRAKPFTMRKV